MAPSVRLRTGHLSVTRRRWREAADAGSGGRSGAQASPASLPAALALLS